MAKRVVVAGAGVGGLASALALGRAGHDVTLLERDALPAAPDVEAAFTADRRAGDEELAVLIVRRTTFEWVLRRAVLAQPQIEVRTGVTVARLTGQRASLPVVDGVTLSDGTHLDADVVVASTGRGGSLPGWLRKLGVEVPETVRHSGLMYLSRWYRLPAGLIGELDPKLGGDLGFVKYLAVPGDGDTLSVTLAIPSEADDLRAALSDADGFEEACRILPGPDQFFSKGPLEPVGGVRPMGGLLNRLRRFVDSGGAPTVLGFHAVGDAHTCTNPLYGRGCALALVMAGLLADAVAESPDDATARAAAYEAACVREVEPWYHGAVQMDSLGADPAGFGGLGPTDADGAKAMSAVFVAAATDPILGRGLARFWNLLATQSDLLADAEFIGRMAEVMSKPDDYPRPPRVGPSRDELLAALRVGPT